MIDCGRKFTDEGHSSSEDIKARCDQLQEKWDELKDLADVRYRTSSFLEVFAFSHWGLLVR